MNSRRSAPPALNVHIASTDNSPRASVSLDGIEEVAVEDLKMGDSFVPSRPLSVAIPRNIGAQGPYCPRRPNLSEILANDSPPPWTLSAFMAYLSQNHCLETLEFTMDASRYGKHYTKMVGRIPGGVLLPTSEEANYLLMLWQRLLEAYIAPNGPREVNLPAEVRNALLALANGMGGMPPPPNTLDVAVQHVYSLMEESVLIPFLNSCYPQTTIEEYNNSSSENLNSASAPIATHGYSQSASTNTFGSHSYQDSGFYRRSKRRSSPNQQNQPMSASYTASSAGMFSPSAATNRASAPSTLTQIARGFSVRGGMTGSSSQRSSASPFEGARSPSSTTDTDMTDDLMSTVSTNSISLSNTASADANGAGLHTPPTTPPMSDCQPYEGSPLSATMSLSSPTATQMSVESPKEGTWKRVGTKLGLRKSGTSSGIGRQRSAGSPGGVAMEED